MSYLNRESQPVSDAAIEAMYVDMLDECNDAVRIGSLTYSPSRVLSSVDPIAYRIGLSEYVDSLIEDGELTESE